ncbi:MAG: Uma2 family endonuclease [Armatimonadetes bacterium]|nr:Uma2 family endonuclease [Armatimonadota bacterium]
MQPVPRTKTDKKYSWQDYLKWPDEERWEVIDGIAYDMSPSPTPRHQILAGNFYGILRNKLHGKRCRPFVAPLDVYLDDHNFVQPDVLAICDEVKIKDRIYGAPDMVVEVLSPSTSLKDKREKKTLYERFGVKEYVVIHPDEVFIERYALKEGRYGEPDLYGATEVLSLHALDEMEIPLWEVFETEPPQEADAQSSAEVEVK